MLSVKSRLSSRFTPQVLIWPLKNSLHPQFCFELYDFNLNAALSLTEICMMMQSSVCGMLVLTGGDEDDEPGIQAFEVRPYPSFVTCK